MKDVAGKKVAILVADNFEQVEMTEPRKALDQAGVATFIVSPADGEVKGVNHDQPGDTFKAGRLGDYTVDQDGTVLLGPPTVFTKDNIDQFDF